MDINIETNTYAVVKSGVVANIVVWDGKSDWEPGDGTKAVVVPNDTLVEIGGTYDGTEFTKSS